MENKFNKKSRRSLKLTLQQATGYFLNSNCLCLSHWSKLQSIQPSWSNKKAVSLIISYVLLITIALIMSGIVYSYLKVASNIEPVIACEPGTSIIIEDYGCQTGRFTITIKNNGRFSIDGFSLAVGENVEREPINILETFTTTGNLPTVNLKTSEGYYELAEKLTPSSNVIIEFTNIVANTGSPIESGTIANIRIQPYIVDEEKNADVFCRGAIIRQRLQNCNI